MSRVTVLVVKILELHKKKYKLRYKIFKKSKSNHQSRIQKQMSQLNGLILRPRSVRMQYNQKYENGNV